MDYEMCPNCNVYFDEVDDYYEEPEIFDYFWRTWHYICPNCGKKYNYTRYYRCTSEELEEENEENSD